MMGGQQSPQAETMTIPKKWPLVSRLQTRAPIAVPLPGGTLMPITKDAHLINCFAEFDPEDQEYWIYKRLGLSTTPFATTSVGPGGGIFTASNGAIVAVSNSNLWIGGRSLAFTNVGSIGTSPFYEPYTFVDAQAGVGGTRYVMITNYGGGQPAGSAAALRALNLSTGLLVSLTGAFGGTGVVVPGGAFVDGTFYFMDSNGTIQGSDINNPINYTALNVIQANASPDAGVYLAKQLNYVVAYKQWSTQIFFDNGNPPPGSPLSPVPESQIPIGMLDASTFQNIDDTHIWMTSNHDVSPQIARLDNLTVKIVSTPAVEKILANYLYSVTFVGIAPPVATVVGLISWKLKWGGHRFYGLTIQQLNITLVYDIDQDLWYYWTDQNGNYWPVSGIAYGLPLVQNAVPTSAPGQRYAQHASNGNIYTLDAAAAIPTDLGQLYPVDIYTPNVRFLNRRALINDIYFQTDQVPGSYMLARYSDNDFRTWSNFRKVNLDRQKPQLSKEGTVNGHRAYHFRHLLATDFRIKTAGLEVDLGVK